MNSSIRVSLEKFVLPKFTGWTLHSSTLYKSAASLSKILIHHIALSCKKIQPHMHTRLAPMRFNVCMRSQDS